MSAFYTLKVNAIQRETADSVAISFDVPDELKEKFVFLPGQYLTLKLQLEGAEIRRSYSICSSPLFGEKLGVAVKKVKDGKASTYLNEQLKVGDSLEVMTPMGNFYPSISGNNSKIYYLFAGGSGITPMMSIMKSVLKSEPNSKVNLFY
ncbi:MAG TPA: FAD-binding oxidoreductase, partial [Saprospiraceae bacterium]|nr:FAD-binding oxidoreductase [Saprospiraceae bacterium]